jgi:hypothetical protein
MQIGSFTQLVWKNSRLVGIGIAYTDSGCPPYIITQYSPPRNFDNEYQDNVFSDQR